MSTLIYFVPNTSAMTGIGAGYTKVGLKHLVGTSCASRQWVNGPGGQNGCVFVPHGAKSEPAVNVEYRAETQTWYEADGYWVGFQNDVPVTPRSLIRENVLRGLDIKMADDQLWHIPAAIRLPRRVQVTKSGELVYTPQDRYREFYAIAEKLAYWSSDPDIDVQDIEVFHAISHALGMNYHVSDAEVSLLGLVTTENWSPCLWAIRDVDMLSVMEAAIAEAQKKTEFVDTPA